MTHRQLLCLGHCYKFRFLTSSIYLRLNVQHLCSSKTLVCCCVWVLTWLHICPTWLYFQFYEPYSWTLSMYLKALRRFRVSLCCQWMACTFDNICPDVKLSQCPFVKSQRPLLAFAPKTWGNPEPRSSSAGYLSVKERILHLLRHDVLWNCVYSLSTGGQWLWK